MRRWLAALSVYRDRRILLIFCLGFSSGTPLLLTSSTLSYWLSEEDIPIGTIGLFALVGLPYALKFLWSPLIDGLRVPLLAGLLGPRRAWAITVQLALVATIIALGTHEPKHELMAMAVLALVVAFLSATQDIVVDAYRIEILEKAEQGTGAAAIQAGYRLAMLVVGAGGFVIGGTFGWSVAYAAMAALVAVGIAAVLFAGEPQAPEGSDGARAGSRNAADRDWLKRYVIVPFSDYMQRPAWPVILLFILLFKLGDAVAGVMANTFYQKTGFTPLEIAEVSKTFGFFATIFGLFLGGLVVTRLGFLKGLLLCGALQMGSNLMYALQASVGHDVTLLYATIGIENVSGGMGSAAFVAYLSSLCSFGLAATQYALLSSIAMVARTGLASGGGFLVEAIGWVNFFIASTGAALPGLIVLLWLMRFMRRRAQPATDPGA